MCPKKNCGENFVAESDGISQLKKEYSRKFFRGFKHLRKGSEVSQKIKKLILTKTINNKKWQK